MWHRKRQDCGSDDSSNSASLVLLQECRRAYERLPSETQYRMKQLCAEDGAVRNNSKAFLHAIYSITGQGRPQPAYEEGELIPPPIAVRITALHMALQLCSGLLPLVRYGALMMMACRRMHLCQLQPSVLSQDVNADCLWSCRHEWCWRGGAHPSEVVRLLR